MVEFLLVAPVLIASVVVHEVAHAWQARREGDFTAAEQGRITLNPLKHLDLFGSVLVPALLWFGQAGFLFGWARPVPVVPQNYRDPKWGDVRVSLAGVTANLLLAVAFALLGIARVAVPAELFGDGGVAALQVVGAIAWYGVFINLILALFNLIPLPPLDGSHVLARLLPERLARGYRRFGQFGLLVLMILLFVVPDVFGVLMFPVEWLMRQLAAFVQSWA